MFGRCVVQPGMSANRVEGKKNGVRLSVVTAHGKRPFLPSHGPRCACGNGKVNAQALQCHDDMTVAGRPAAIAAL